MDNSELAAVRTALLAAAHRDAADAVARGTAVAATTLAKARTEADRLTAAAREEGAAQARTRLATELAQARREAHTRVLAAESEAFMALRTAARHAVAAMINEPGFAVVRRRMAREVRRVLGPGAVVRDIADGVVGDVAGRRVRLSLLDRADTAVELVVATSGAEPPTAELNS